MWPKVGSANENLDRQVANIAVGVGVMIVNVLGLWTRPPRSKMLCGGE